MNFRKLAILILLFLVSCKNYYNDTIEWADSLEAQLSLTEVQKLQPDFVVIDWENPIVNDTEKWYLISKIKGNIDMVSISNYLVFINDKFQYREARK